MLRVRSAELSMGVSVLVVAGIALLLFLTKALLVPLAFALLLYFLLVPMVARLEKQRVPRSLAVALSMALACAGILLVGWVLFWQVLNVTETLPQYRENIQQRIHALRVPEGSSLRKSLDNVEELGGQLFPRGANAGPEAAPVRLVEPEGTQLSNALGTIGNVLQPFGELAIVLIFAIYMLMKREELRHRLLLLAGMGRINVMTRALDDAASRISRYLAMQFIVNACYGLLFGCGLQAIGVPDAVLWGVLAAVLRAVPYVGTAVGMLLPLTLSIAVSSSWWSPLTVLGLFVVLEGAITNFVEPWLFSSRTGVSSLALLASAIFWTMLWGWAGLVLSTPLTVCVVILGRYVPQFNFLYSLLDTDAQLSPAAHMYERLLAGDQGEAQAITERYLRGHTLAELYDLVLIPALGLTEEDRHKGAIDAVRSNFIFLCVGELVARLVAHPDKSAVPDAPSTRSVLLETMRVAPIKEFAVVCISARDKADEIVTEMLTQVLERGGYQTLTLRADALSAEILGGLAAEPDTVFFISALPPFAFAEVRTLCQHTRGYLAENRLAVGLWDTTEDSDEMLARFGAAQPNVVVGSLKDAMRQVKAWRRETHQS